MKKLSLVEVINRAVAKISELEDAEKFLEKAASKVSDCQMSTILIKVILGATILRISDDRKKVKEMIEEVEKEIDGLGIVPQVHRYLKRPQESSAIISSSVDSMSSPRSSTRSKPTTDFTTKTRSNILES